MEARQGNLYCCHQNVLTYLFIYLKYRGVTQWVKQLTLELSSGLDFRVVGAGPALGSAPGVQPTLEIKQYRTLILEQAPCS